MARGEMCPAPFNSSRSGVLRVLQPLLFMYCLSTMAIKNMYIDK